VPTVRTLHGSALREAQNATRFVSRLSMYGLFALEHFSTRLCRLPLAIGRDAAAIYGIKDIVSNGVDAKVFFPGPKHPTPRILFVGVWKGRKRGQFVYETFIKDVLPRVPNAELCVVSDYCPPHPNVVVERFPDDATLAQRFREAWVVASASTYEGFGIPYIEALASGTSVVTSPNQGAREVLDDGEYGIIVEDRSFGSTLASLLQDSGRRSTLERKGLERARAYSWRAVAMDHRRLYLKLLGGR
jgi:phosphatidyl-myo-inositol alpha-mannosyltransferase